MAESGILGFEKRGGEPGLPWTQKFVEALPVAPGWGGLVLAFAHLSLDRIDLKVGSSSD